MSLKLVSLNIEAQKHLPTVSNFLDKENADVVCLMEVCEKDVLQIAGNKYQFAVFAPSDILLDGKVTGVAILSKHPIFEVVKYHCGENISEYTSLPRVRGTHAPTLIMAKIMEGENEYQIGAIHFSWTKDGHENSRQEGHMEKLLEFLGRQGEFVLCGDFNIPRGYKLYEKLNTLYKDNIPSEVLTTIDPEIHRANKDVREKLKLVVDYIFSTPKYRVDNVRVESGVSDHCGVVCQIDKI